MSIESAIIAGFGAVSTAIRSLRQVVTGSVTGGLSSLTTISKLSIISAINELRSAGNLGFRYTFGQTSQPGRTWVLANPLTSIYNNASSVVTQSGGVFTFSPNTAPNVNRNWLFHIEAASTSAGVPIGVEIRINGVAQGRSVVGAMSSASGLATRATLSMPIRLSGGETVSFHFYHDATGLLGVSVSSDIGGIVSGVCL